MFGLQDSARQDLLHRGNALFQLWLDNATTSEIWQQCIAPLFSSANTPPRFFAKGRHSHLSCLVTEEQATAFLNQVPLDDKIGFSMPSPPPHSAESLFLWQEDRIIAMISGETPSPSADFLFLIRMFLWKVLNDLKQKDLEVDTIHDEITSAYNQHYLRRLIDMELDRGKRYGVFFSLLFLDLDNLKAVNEQHGHLIGTSVLKEVSGLIQSSVRRGDAVARFGGDEFVILLLHSHPQDARIVAERILKTLSRHTFLQEKNLSMQISASIGITGFPDHGNTTEALIQKADIAMYQVKQSGKNGIEIYQGE